jgi:hypothetical protein
MMKDLLYVRYSFYIRSKYRLYQLVGSQLNVFTNAAKLTAGMSQIRQLYVRYLAPKNVVDAPTIPRSAVD